MLVLENQRNSGTPRLLKHLLFAIAAIGLAAHVAHAEEQPATIVHVGGALPKPDADGFITMFDGRDLNGWSGLQGYWYARDGAISGRQTRENSKQTFLVFTEFNVRDFELRLKYRFASPGGNSGVQFRSKILDAEAYRVGGYQADMDAAGDFDGSIYDEAGVAGGRGTMSNRGETTTWNAKNERSGIAFGDSSDLKKLIKIGDWNDFALAAIGKHITYSINGRVMTDLTDESPNAMTDGILALQLHEGFTMEVQFKDLKIRLLDQKKSD
jgi:hypothetical protein